MALGHLMLLMFLGIVLANAQTFTTARPLAGDDVIRRYFERAMVYPQEALQKNIRGNVVISFEVSPDGSTSNYAIAKSVDPAIDAEALRLASHILWQPALAAGQPVLTRQTLTINFNPKKYVRNRTNTFDYAFTQEEINLLPAPIFKPKELSEPPQPILPDKFRSLTAYVSHLMKYPELAVKHNISGTVKLVFVIETNGLASNIVVSESLGGGCDLEAISILEQLRWIPGKKEGKFVRSQAELEIVFKINEHKLKAIPNQRNTGL